MKVIAVTGLMGSGKSEVLKLLKKKGYCVLQADKLVKTFLQASSPCFEELKSLLSPIALTEKGELCVSQIAEEVFFKNPWKLKKLESILHPLVRKSLKAFVAQKKTQGEPYVFYEIPLLSQKSLIENQFDCSIFLLRPKASTIKSLIQKGWKRMDIMERLKRQEKGMSFKKKANFVLHNTGDLKELSCKLNRILENPIFSNPPVFKNASI